ncbi:dead end protein 1 [Diretmus argenteus]
MVLENLPRTSAREFSEEQNQKRLERWMKETNIKLTQVNGQRKYGGPPEVWDGPRPGAHCEVFISQIPRDVYEDLLIPLFGSIGPLWEFRLMMNFSGANRGFAYAKYGSPALAAAAISLLHGHMLEPGVSLSVRRSIEKRHLCLGGLPSSSRREELMQVGRLLSDGVEGVSLKTRPGQEEVTAVVSFSSHHAASMAKKVLVGAFKSHFAMTVSIKWQSSVKSRKLPAAAPQSSVPTPGPFPPPPPSPAGGFFCRAVGGPIALRPAPRPSSGFSQGSPVSLLENVCEAFGFGPPHYELHYSHAGDEGFLYFNYEVHVPGMTAAPFTGLATTLPGRTALLDQARQAAAQQILRLIN